MATVADIVRVSTSILAGGIASRDFGRTLFIQKVTAEITGLKQAQALRTIPVYASASALAAGDLSDDTTAAGNVYFAQAPFPRNLSRRYVDRCRPADPDLLAGGPQYRRY